MDDAVDEGGDAERGEVDSETSSANVLVRPRPRPSTEDEVMEDASSNNEFVLASTGEEVSLSDSNKVERDMLFDRAKASPDDCLFLACLCKA